MPPLLVVATVVFLEVVCLGAVIPSLTPFTESLGGSVLLGGVMFALVSGPKIFANPIWGHASDRFGRKPVFVGLTVMTLCSSLIWAFTEDLAAVTGITALFWLGLSRLIHGLFSAQATIAFAVASDTSLPEKRAAALGVLGAAFGAGLAVGFPLGGIFAEAWSYAAIGWLCAGCETAALVILLLTLRETRDGRLERSPVSPVRLLIQPTITLLAVVCVIATVGLSVMTPTLSPYLEDLHGFSKRDIGWAFFVFGIVSIIVQGGLIRPIVRHFGERPTFVAGTIILAAGFVCIALEPAMAGLWSGIVLIGLGAGLSGPTLAAMFSLAVPPDQQGAAHGLNQGCTALGRTISYPLAGGLYQLAIALPYWIGGALLLVGLVPLVRLRNQK
jgi:DHA1 family tetracycline resistance protein-like MFS transporter